MERAVARQPELSDASDTDEDLDPREIVGERTREMNELIILKWELEASCAGEPKHVVSDIGKQIAALEKKISKICQRMRW